MCGSSAMAITVDISDITSNEVFADILRRLRDDEPNFDEVRVQDYGVSFIDGGDNQVCWCRLDAREMGVLGQYVSRSTQITRLSFSIEEEFDVDVVESFFVGLPGNRSIQKVLLLQGHCPRALSQMLMPFFKASPNVDVFESYWCQMNAEQYRALSLALGEGKSLIKVSLGGLASFGDLIDDDRYDDEESIVANIEALKMHPQLEELQFRRFVMGRNACCIALSGLLQQASAGMQQLNLNQNNIDDTGVEALVDGLAHCRCLRQLQLATNPSITARGWRALSTLLKDPNSRLALLNLMGNGIVDEIAVIFATALAHNRGLERLYLCRDRGHDSEGVTGESWVAFSKVLCDTSSVNSTFLSNHTLHTLGRSRRNFIGNLPDQLVDSFSLNRENDKKRVAFRKVLLYHDDFDMQPLFEWDLKVLPFVVSWFERAAAYGIEAEECNRKRKLAAIYQFTRGMPELTTESILGVNKKSAQTGK